MHAYAMSPGTEKIISAFLLQILKIILKYRESSILELKGDNNR